MLAAIDLYWAKNAVTLTLNVSHIVILASSNVVVLTVIFVNENASALVTTTSYV